MSPRLKCAAATPWSAARRYHRTASRIVRPNAACVGVHHSEAELRAGDTLDRRHAVPSHGFGSVRRNPESEVEPSTKDVLRLGVTPFGHLDVSTQEFRIASHRPDVRRLPVTLVHHPRLGLGMASLSSPPVPPDLVLGVRVTSLSRQVVPPLRLVIVARNAMSCRVHHREAVLCLGITPLGRLQQRVDLSGVHVSRV